MIDVWKAGVIYAKDNTSRKKREKDPKKSKSTNKMSKH